MTNVFLQISKYNLKDQKPNMIYLRTHSGCPRKNALLCSEDPRVFIIELQIKVGQVLENSGNFLSNEHKNFAVWSKNDQEKWPECIMPCS